MDRNALAELLQALESRRDAEERRREERYTALIERVAAEATREGGEWNLLGSFPGASRNNRDVEQQGHHRQSKPPDSDTPGRHLASAAESATLKPEELHSTN
ncbi:UNVERIFIED_CONTAM: hypothetical protein FKN15_031460 [Acipenser sinensis]